jgi:hypothetical protein
MKTSPWTHPAVELLCVAGVRASSVAPPKQRRIEVWRTTSRCHFFWGGGGRHYPVASPKRDPQKNLGFRKSIQMIYLMITKKLKIKSLQATNY